MKPSLQVRLSQHLALTPQLQQSIRLLQLSTLELHQEVEQMLEQNPFLEPEEEGGSVYDTPPPAVERSTNAAEREELDAGGSGDGDGEALSEIRADEFGTPLRDDWENGTEGDDFDGIRENPSSGTGADSEGDDFDGQDRRATGGSLAEYLRAQLTGLRLEPDDLAAVHVLIESLDADGYLADSLEDIAGRLAEMFGLEPAADAGRVGDEAGDDLDDDVDDEAGEEAAAPRRATGAPAAAGSPNAPTDADADADAAEHEPAPRAELMRRLQFALRWLQRLDPPGVGARSLPECLVLQLRARAPCAAQTVAITICEQHLELLARRDMKKLAAAVDVTEDLVREAQALIVTCEPKPGRPFGASEANIVVPDVIVQRGGRSLKVMLNPDVIPKLRINDLYAQAVKGQRNGNAAGMSSRLQEARWFMKNIQQRFDTILRVSKAIVERQKSFFTHGAIAMKPLVLREIADELGLHESTISRVTTAKYMATPYGTFELKYFFGSSLNTDAGGNASSTAVRALIQQLVEAEDEGKPLSDSQLSKMLEEQGIQVARRTVAKYREALRIAPASLRKTL